MPPAGRFVLPESDGSPRHVVAFAAGAGITPIMAMLKHALAHGAGDRASRSSTATAVPTASCSAEELEDLKDRHLGRFTLLHVLSRNEESSAPLFEGRITGDKVKAFAATLFKPGEVAHVFLCGPGSMIKEARNALLELGVPREQGASRVLRAGRRCVSGKAGTGSDPSPPPLAAGSHRFARGV